MSKQHLNTKEFLWVALIFWCASFTAIEAPFSFVFKTKIQPWQLVVDAVISLLFVADLIYHLREAKKNKDKHDVGSPQKKWFFPLMLTVDILACIPFDLLSNYLGHQDLFIAFRLMRMIRIIKVFYLIENITIVPSLFKMQSIVVGFLMVVNWIACGWIFIYPMTADTDVTSYYIRSFYWALTTLSTIGYGDIVPHDNIGRIFTCFIMIIGVGMYGIVIGNISRMLASADRHKEQSREKISDLLMFMKHYKIPDGLQTAAINHYSHLFSKRLSNNDEKIISDLPHAIQQEMQIYMKIKLISNIPIFVGCPHECLKDVSTHLEQIYSSPGDLIIKIGDIGEEMFLIAHGVVDVILESGERVASLHDGQIFGEIALLSETTRTANIQSQAYCDLYKLTKKSFNDIVKRYPVLLKNIESTTQRRSSDKSQSGSSNGKS
ncbi:MAG: cyclic nucleotide-binding domain-containing protein [Bacteriovorax sp.]|nr:cyclic nucleotide-binding domain-containing protein [Bacteriovorax sp.]